MGFDYILMRQCYLLVRLFMFKQICLLWTSPSQLRSTHAVVVYLADAIISVTVIQWPLFTSESELSENFLKSFTAQFFFFYQDISWLIPFY